MIVKIVETCVVKDLLLISQTWYNTFISDHCVCIQSMYIYHMHMQMQGPRDQKFGGGLTTDSVTNLTKTTWCICIDTEASSYPQT